MSNFWEYCSVCSSIGVLVTVCHLTEVYFGRRQLRNMWFTYLSSSRCAEFYQHGNLFCEVQITASPKHLVEGVAIERCWHSCVIRRYKFSIPWYQDWRDCRINKYCQWSGLAHLVALAIIVYDCQSVYRGASAFCSQNMPCHPILSSPTTKVKTFLKSKSGYSLIQTLKYGIHHLVVKPNRPL